MTVLYENLYYNDLYYKRNILERNYLKFKFNFWNVHGIMIILGLLHSQALEGKPSMPKVCLFGRKSFPT